MGPPLPGGGIVTFRGPTVIASAIKALKEEGYRVIVVNSNPATIMTDPELADATYGEPITPAYVAEIIAKDSYVT